jgi:hypothetical protein
VRDRRLGGDVGLLDLEDEVGVRALGAPVREERAANGRLRVGGNVLAVERQVSGQPGHLRPLLVEIDGERHPDLALNGQVGLLHGEIDVDPRQLDTLARGRGRRDLELRRDGACRRRQRHVGRNRLALHAIGSEGEARDHGLRVEAILGLRRHLHTGQGHARGLRIDVDRLAFDARVESADVLRVAHDIDVEAR